MPVRRSVSWSAARAQQQNNSSPPPPAPALAQSTPSSFVRRPTILDSSSSAAPSSSTSTIRFQQGIDAMLVDVLDLEEEVSRSEIVAEWAETVTSWDEMANLLLNAAHRTASPQRPVPWGSPSRLSLAAHPEESPPTPERPPRRSIRVRRIAAVLDQDDDDAEGDSVEVDPSLVDAVPTHPPQPPPMVTRSPGAPVAPPNVTLALLAANDRIVELEHALSQAAAAREQLLRDKSTAIEEVRRASEQAMEAQFAAERRLREVEMSSKASALEAELRSTSLMASLSNTYEEQTLRDLASANAARDAALRREEELQHRLSQLATEAESHKARALSAEAEAARIRHSITDERRFALASSAAANKQLGFVAGVLADVEHQLREGLRASEYTTRRQLQHYFDAGVSTFDSEAATRREWQTQERKERNGIVRHALVDEETMWRRIIERAALTGQMRLSLTFASGTVATTSVLVRRESMNARTGAAIAASLQRQRTVESAVPQVLASQHQAEVVALEKRLSDAHEVAKTAQSDCAAVLNRLQAAEADAEALRVQIQTLQRGTSATSDELLAARRDAAAALEEAARARRQLDDYQRIAELRRESDAQTTTRQLELEEELRTLRQRMAQDKLCLEAEQQSLADARSQASQLRQELQRLVELREADAARVSHLEAERDRSSVESEATLQRQRQLLSAEAEGALIINHDEPAARARLRDSERLARHRIALQVAEVEERRMRLRVASEEASARRSLADAANRDELQQEARYGHRHLEWQWSRFVARAQLESRYLSRAASMRVGREEYLVGLRSAFVATSARAAAGSALREELQREEAAFVRTLVALLSTEEHSARSHLAQKAVNSFAELKRISNHFVLRLHPLVDEHRRAILSALQDATMNVKRRAANHAFIRSVTTAMDDESDERIALLHNEGARRSDIAHRCREDFAVAVQHRLTRDVGTHVAPAIDPRSYDTLTEMEAATRDEIITSHYAAIRLALDAHRIGLTAAQSATTRRLDAHDAELRHVEDAVEYTLHAAVHRQQLELSEATSRHYIVVNEAAARREAFPPLKRFARRVERHLRHVAVEFERHSATAPYVLLLDSVEAVEASARSELLRHALDDKAELAVRHLGAFDFARSLSERTAVHLAFVTRSLRADSIETSEALTRPLLQQDLWRQHQRLLKTLQPCYALHDIVLQKYDMFAAWQSECRRMCRFHVHSLETQARRKIQVAEDAAFVHLARAVLRLVEPPRSAALLSDRRLVSFEFQSRHLDPTGFGLQNAERGLATVFASAPSTAAAILAHPSHDSLTLDLAGMAATAASVEATTDALLEAHVIALVHCFEAARQAVYTSTHHQIQQEEVYEALREAQQEIAVRDDELQRMQAVALERKEQHRRELVAAAEAKSRRALDFVFVEVARAWMQALSARREHFLRSRVAASQVYRHRVDLEESLARQALHDREADERRDCIAAYTGWDVTSAIGRARLELVQDRLTAATVARIESQRQVVVAEEASIRRTLVARWSIAHSDGIRYARNYCECLLQEDTERHHIQDDALHRRRIFIDRQCQLEQREILSRREFQQTCLDELFAIESAYRAVHASMQSLHFKSLDAIAESANATAAVIAVDHAVMAERTLVRQEISEEYEALLRDLHSRLDEYADRVAEARREVILVRSQAEWAAQTSMSIMFALLHEGDLRRAIEGTESISRNAIEGQFVSVLVQLDCRRASQGGSATVAAAGLVAVAEHEGLVVKALRVHGDFVAAVQALRLTVARTEPTARAELQSDEGVSRRDCLRSEVRARSLIGSSLILRQLMALETHDEPLARAVLVRDNAVQRRTTLLLCETSRRSVIANDCREALLNVTMRFALVVRPAPPQAPSASARTFVSEGTTTALAVTDSDVASAGDLTRDDISLPDDTVVSSLTTSERAPSSSKSMLLHGRRSVQLPSVSTSRGRATTTSPDPVPPPAYTTAATSSSLALQTPTPVLGFNTFRPSFVPPLQLPSHSPPRPPKHPHGFSVTVAPQYLDNIDAPAVEAVAEYPPRLPSVASSEASSLSSVGLVYARAGAPVVSPRRDHTTLADVAVTSPQRQARSSPERRIATPPVHNTAPRQPTPSPPRAPPPSAVLVDDITPAPMPDPEDLTVKWREHMSAQWGIQRLELESSEHWARSLVTQLEAAEADVIQSRITRLQAFVADEQRLAKLRSMSRASDPDDLPSLVVTTATPRTAQESHYAPPPLLQSMRDVRRTSVMSQPSSRSPSPAGALPMHRGGPAAHLHEPIGHDTRRSPRREDTERIEGWLWHQQQEHRFSLEHGHELRNRTVEAVSVSGSLNRTVSDLSSIVDKSPRADAWRHASGATRPPNVPALPTSLLHLQQHNHHERYTRSPSRSPPAAPYTKTTLMLPSEIEDAESMRTVGSSGVQPTLATDPHSPLARTLPPGQTCGITTSPPAALELAQDDVTPIRKTATHQQNSSSQPSPPTDTLYKAYFGVKLSADPSLMAAAAAGMGSPLTPRAGGRVSTVGTSSTVRSGSNGRASSVSNTPRGSGRPSLLPGLRVIELKAPGSHCGLHVGDVVLSINGVVVHKLEEANKELHLVARRTVSADAHTPGRFVVLGGTAAQQRAAGGDGFRLKVLRPPGTEDPFEVVIHPEWRVASTHAHAPSTLSEGSALVQPSGWVVPSPQQQIHMIRYGKGASSIGATVPTRSWP